jgi:RimJ/RimL family protein N-acetyltransferase
MTHAAAASFAMQVIETPRLRLVVPAARHIPAYQEFIASDRAIARGWGAMPHEAWRNFAALLGHGILRGFGPLVAEEKSDGRAIGLFGPWHPEGQAEREVKWSIWSGADEGQGFAPGRRHDARSAAQLPRRQPSCSRRLGPPRRNP